MAVVSEFMCQLTVVSATGLPKTDLLSKIDAYVVLKFPNGQKLKTKTIDNHDAPVWNQVFLPIIPKHPAGFLTGQVDIELWDENVLKDELVCVACVKFDDVKHPQELQQVSLPLAFKSSKHKGTPTLQLRFEGFVQSFFSLKNMWSVVPGFLCNEKAKACYIPIPDMAGVLYVAVEYEGNAVDFKVYTTRPQQKNLFVDMVNQAGTQRTKAIRRSYPKGRQIVPGLLVYEEVKLDDVPITSDFSMLSAVVFDSVPLSTTNAAQVVKAHGWRGALNFREACRVLHNVMIDQQEMEIYMQVDPNETMLLVDYDEDDVDIKLAVLANPATADKGYDLTIRGQDCKKYSQVWLPYKAKLGGQVLVSRLFELDDVDYGTSFNDIEINRYQLHNPRSFSVQSVTRIMG